MQNEETTSSHLNDSGIVPTGYRILVRIPEKRGRTNAGLYIPEDVKKNEEIASLCGLVLELGPLCYQDTAKFGRDVCDEDGDLLGQVTDPWCKPGDYILMAAYSGIRLKVPGRSEEYRLINDDNVCAVVPSADGVERA